MNINGLKLNDADLSQRYKGTFVIAEIGVQPPAVIRMSNFGNGLFTVFNKEGGEEVFNQNDCRILRDFPEMGAVNYQGDVHYLLRKPLRQWQRGLSANLVHDFCRNSSAFPFSRAINHDSADACFNRVWIPVEEGIKQNLASFAINAHYWISGRKRKYLWRDMVCLGEIMGKRLFAFPDVCIMREEINQELGGCYEIN